MTDPLHSTPYRLPAAQQNGAPIAGVATGFGGTSGGIQGPLLRPGSIDQPAFLKELAKAQARQMAATPSPPPQDPPELSLAQFQALIKRTGPTPSMPGAPSALSAALSAQSPPTPTPLPVAAPMASAASPVEAAAMPTDQAPLPPAPQATIERVAGGTSATPAQASGADPAANPIDSDVIVLHRRPDKDAQDMLRGRDWRVVEDPRARSLFFGPDGEFGFDDFVDLINPLQHIPLINVAYRALTGDQIAGGPQLMGSAILGPVGVMSTIADLAVRSVTGEGMAGTALAMLTGEKAELGDNQIALQSDITDRGARRS